MKRTKQERKTNIEEVNSMKLNLEKAERKRKVVERSSTNS